MKNRIAKDMDEAYDICYNQTDRRARTQWNGTDLCMDFVCDCGDSWHIDGMFAYSVKCPACNAVYYLNPNIELIRLKEPPDENKYCEPLVGQ